MEYQNDQPAEQGYDGTTSVNQSIINYEQRANSRLFQVNVTIQRETAVAAQDLSTATMAMTESATVI